MINLSEYRLQLIYQLTIYIILLCFKKIKVSSNLPAKSIEESKT